MSKGSFFELIGRCVMFDICNHIKIINSDLYEEVIAECIESAYEECIGDTIDIECLVKAIHSLNCVYQAVEYLPRFLSGHEQVLIDSLCRLSKILNINVDLDLTDYQSICDDLITNLGQTINASISEDGCMDKIILLHECLIGIQASPDMNMQHLISFERSIQGYFRKFIMDTDSRLVDSRRIARYFKLGIYARLDDTERNFARYVEQFFSYYWIISHHY